MQQLFAASGPSPTWRFMWLALALGLLARVVFGVTNDRIIHSDEVFQYLEPAHRLLYGYGFMAWEWAWGIRSWLIPLVVAGFMSLPGLVGLEGPGYYEVSVVLGFSLINMAIPLGMYRFAQVILPEREAILALVLGCIWPFFWYFGATPLPNMLAASGLIWIAVLMLRPATWGNLALLGVISALTLGARYQVLPAVGLMNLFALIALRGRYLWVMGPGLAVLGLIGLLDVYFWGGFAISFIENFRLNALEDISSKFGEEPFYYYFTTGMIDTGGLIAPMLLGFAALFRRAWPVWLAIAACVVMMHIPKHKEFRFILWMMPFGLVALAHLIGALSLRDVPDRLIKRFFALWITAFTAIYIATQYEAFEPLPHREAPIEVVRLVRGDPDLRGLYIDAGYDRWDRWGGYYHLNRPVPYYVRDAAGDLVSLEGGYRAWGVSHIVTDYPFPPSADAKLIHETQEFYVWKMDPLPEPWGDQPFNMYFYQRNLNIQTPPRVAPYPPIPDRLPAARP